MINPTTGVDEVCVLCRKDGHFAVDCPSRTGGRKDDAEKPRWDLVPWGAVRGIVEVLTYGAKKYAPDNWKHVGMPRERYFSAAMRHLTAWYGGEKLDPESGHHHLAHASCCVLFLLALDRT